MKKARSSRAALIVAVLAVLSLVGLTLYSGPSVICAPTDVFVLLGGAWRISLGQIPHADFSSPLGLVTFALIELGMKLGGVGAAGLSWGVALLVLLVGGWSIRIAFQRMEPWLACGFVIGTALLCSATRPLGYAPSNHSYAMLYNRIGWALLALLATVAFLPRSERSPRGDTLDPLALGALFGLLVYTKISYALFAFPILLAALIFRAEFRRRAALLAAVAGAVSIPLLARALYGVAPLAYIRDLVGAGEAQSIPVRFQMLRNAIDQGALFLALLALAWGLAFALPALRARRWVRRRLIASLQFLLLLSVALGITTLNNGERGEVPFYALAALFLLHHRDVAVAEGVAPPDGIGRIARGALLLAPLLIGGYVGGRDAASLVDTLESRDYRLAGAPPTQRFDAEPLRDFVVPAWSTHRTQFWMATQLPSRLNDGLALLRRHVNGDSRLFVAALTDPFSLALGLTPARGGQLFWDRDVSYRLDAHLPAEQVLSEVTLIMIPRLVPEDAGCCKEPATDLPEMFDSYIGRHFVEQDRSQYWRLLVRNGA